MDVIEKILGPKIIGKVDLSMIESNTRPVKKKKLKRKPKYKKPDSCIKIKYTESGAISELKRSMREQKKMLGHTSRRERRAYLCPHCGSFHLTSISEKEHGLRNKNL